MGTSRDVIINCLDKQKIASEFDCPDYPIRLVLYSAWLILIPFVV